MKSAIQFLLYTAKGFKSRIGIILIIGLAEVVLSLAFVWISKAVIDVATGERAGELLQYSLVLVGLVLLQILVRVWDSRLRKMTRMRLGNSVRYNVFSRLLHTRWQELSTLHSGDMLTRIIKDTDDVTEVTVNAFPAAILAVVQLLGALAILIFLDPTLALILGVGMPLLAVFSRLYYRYMRKYTLEVKESESLITSMMEESLLNQVVIRTFERQENELDKLDKLQSRLHQSVHKKTRVSVLANLFMGVTFNGGYITAFLWSAFGLAKNKISFGTVTAYLQLVNRLQRPLFELSRLLPTIVGSKAAIERLIYLTGFSLEESKDKILLKGNVTLRVENITFSYTPEAEPVLSDFSMLLEPGTMVALMGETGVGKTTLLRLLLALVKPDSGRIVLEDESGQVAVSERTRSNFVYVPQGGSLFSGTIRENLLLGDPGASDQDLTRALKIASANFVFQLPRGLDTELGESGAGLSQGQAQRVAIARALLRPGKILLLDEATSALDSRTARTFLQNLKKEAGDRAILLITHQRWVADFCDRRYDLSSV
ncbi:MAG: putative ABC transporter ATP-binding protein [Bacteroidetes bacterium ADurb.Bin139]|nr:MAG: putative ABC transporter ATP-binding protein [Bacteroidetes bacterium ADurb.Bin139]HOZ19950.1 ABC transporter ATP-binding protein [Bacteroidales bacterium]HPB78461.1 ABC transporter ATP-binding protein [Bacteroidales bacterium]HQN82604.1 ABC transporter ATP-binding protein [Bacteroidales bacterium]HQP64855.1 ABC transporter ATP-binding protein [Bacteroidales bacterium]